MVPGATTLTAATAAAKIIGRAPAAGEWRSVLDAIRSGKALLQVSASPPSKNDIYLVPLCGKLVSVVFDPRQHVIITVMPRHSTSRPSAAVRRGKCHRPRQEWVDRRAADLL